MTCIDTALAHERLHALYFLSPTYRTLLASLWNELPKSIASAVECDLRMRGYNPSVWQDELGAYLGIHTSSKSRRDDPANEFGNKSAPVCAEIRRVLLQQIPQCWKDDVGIDESDVTISIADVDDAKKFFATHRIPVSALPPPSSTQAKSHAQRRSRSKK